MGTSLSSLVIASGEATGFVYPVGSLTVPPTEQGGNGNPFRIVQNFNTSSIYGGSSSSPNGGWCGTSGLAPVSGYTIKLACEVAGNKWVYGHTGVDLSNNGVCGGEIKTIADGVVEFSGGLPGYGYLRKIRHTLPNGRLVYSMYGHMGSLKTLSSLNVSKGQVIGYVGGTGNASGIKLYSCHLHFAIFDQDMPLNGAVTPVGYLYDDNGYTASGGTVVSPNTFRYFYDPLLFVNDRNNEQQILFSGAGSWGVLFSSYQTVTSRTMYLTNGTTIKSLQNGVTAGWMSSQLQHLNGSVWEYLPIVPMDEYTFLTANVYATTYVPSTYLHWFIPGNNYLDARWRGDMTEFTKANASLGFGKAFRDTYQNYPSADPAYGMAMTKYELGGPTTFATVYVKYSISDPLVRYVSYYNWQTGVFSPWVQVH